jgi:hypothetical protein
MPKSLEQMSFKARHNLCDAPTKIAPPIVLHAGNCSRAAKMNLIETDNTELHK